MWLLHVGIVGEMGKTLRSTVSPTEITEESAKIMEVPQDAAYDGLWNTNSLTFKLGRRSKDTQRAYQVQG